MLPSKTLEVDASMSSRILEDVGDLLSFFTMVVLLVLVLLLLAAAGSEAGSRFAMGVL